MFLASPPEHGSVYSIVPCLTWASSQCLRLCFSVCTGQPPPEKAAASSLLKCSAWILGCGSGKRHFQCPQSGSTAHPTGTGEARPPAKCSTSPSDWGTELATESTQPLTSGLQIVSKNISIKIDTQILGPCFLFALPPLTDFAKFAAKGPTCNMRGSAVVLCMCALTYLICFLVMRTLSSKLTRHPISFLWAFFEWFW